MSKFENVWLGVVGGVLTAILLSIVELSTGFFAKLSLETKLFIITIMLLLVFAACMRIILILQRIENPSKPKLIKSHTEPDTYIFIRGKWRKIPDYQTRDYLATVLDFRAGEEDIVLDTKENVAKLPQGRPLESVFTYAKR